MPKAARMAAGEFVLAAVGREDLPKAWKLADPQMKKDCACTYKEWLTGNIPVQYFPTKGLRGAAFSVNEVTPGHVVLEVLLTPGKNRTASGRRRSTSACGSAARRRAVARRLLGASEHRRRARCARRLERAYAYAGNVFVTPTFVTSDV